MTVEPNMFTPSAAAGQAQLPANPANTFITQVIAHCGNVTAAAVSPASTVASALMMFDIAIPDAATTTYTYISTNKIEIVDVIVRKDGAGAANTIQVLDGASAAITDAMAAAVDKTITRAGTIDTAKNVVAAGGSFKITATRAAGTILANVTILVKHRL
jgi:hypothetical protein